MIGPEVDKENEDDEAAKEGGTNHRIILPICLFRGSTGSPELRNHNDEELMHQDTELPSIRPERGLGGRDFGAYLEVADEANEALGVLAAQQHVSPLRIREVLLAHIDAHGIVFNVLHRPGFLIA